MLEKGVEFDTISARDSAGQRTAEFVAAMQADLGKPELEAWAADVGAVKMEIGGAPRNKVLKCKSIPTRRSRRRYWIP